MSKNRENIKLSVFKWCFDILYVETNDPVFKTHSDAIVTLIFKHGDVLIPQERVEKLLKIIENSFKEYFKELTSTQSEGG